MFDRIYRNESKVVAVTKEIEKTIAPDKVTDMYDKVRDEVERSIIRKFIIQENEVHGVVAELAPEYATRHMNIRATLVLNGTEYHFQHSFEQPLTAESAYRLLAEALRDELTATILRTLPSPDLKYHFDHRTRTNRL